MLAILSPWQIFKFKIPPPIREIISFEYARNFSRIKTFFDTSLGTSCWSVCVFFFGGGATAVVFTHANKCPTYFCLKIFSPYRHWWVSWVITWVFRYQLLVDEKTSSPSRIAEIDITPPRLKKLSVFVFKHNRSQEFGKSPFIPKFPQRKS